MNNRIPCYDDENGYSPFKVETPIPPSKFTNEDKNNKQVISNMKSTAPALNPITLKPLET